jgi:hypothetical protein
MLDRRSNNRVALMTRVEVSWKDEVGTEHTTLGRLEDKSKTGANIQVREAIPAGSSVIIRGQRDHFAGTVIYCHPDAHNRHANSDNNQYFIGIQQAPVKTGGEPGGE